MLLEADFFIVSENLIYEVNLAQISFDVIKESGEVFSKLKLIVGVFNCEIAEEFETHGEEVFNHFVGAFLG